MASVSACSLGHRNLPEATEVEGKRPGDGRLGRAKEPQPGTVTRFPFPNNTALCNLPGIFSECVEGSS